VDRLDEFAIFVRIVEESSLVRAANRLRRSAPAVTRALASLEGRLGVRLVDRTPRGAEPNKYGRALLAGGAAVFDDLRQAVKNIEYLADPTAGEVRIGCTPLLATSFVSAVIDRLSRRHPCMVFHLVTGYVEALYGELSARNVDLLLARRFGPIADERLDFEFLFDDSSVVAAGAQSPLARRRRIEFAELTAESWVLPPPGSEIASIAMEAFRASGVDYPRRTVVTDSPHARMSLVATGRFVTILPASALKFPAMRREIKILPLHLPKARAPSGIVTLKSRAVSPVAQLFIDCAREIAKTPGKRK